MAAEHLGRVRRPEDPGTGLPLQALFSGGPGRPARKQWRELGLLECECKCKCEYKFVGHQGAHVRRRSNVSDPRVAGGLLRRRQGNGAGGRERLRGGGRNRGGSRARDGGRGREGPGGNDARKKGEIFLGNKPENQELYKETKTGGTTVLNKRRVARNDGRTSSHDGWVITWRIRQNKRTEQNRRPTKNWSYLFLKKGTPYSLDPNLSWAMVHATERNKGNTILLQ
mmetsp:Transcript_306/g.566  ORF Transcript_306/g.566 Transcript_306/m.566 type:complete len:226 (-) Transcript_306:74-751(-)